MFFTGSHSFSSLKFASNALAYPSGARVCFSLVATNFSSLKFARNALAYQVALECFSPVATNFSSIKFASNAFAYLSGARAFFT